MNQKTLFKLEYDKIIFLKKKRHLSAEDSSAVV